MRILYVVHGFPPRVFAGTESYTYQTVRTLAAAMRGFIDEKKLAQNMAQKTAAPSTTGQCAQRLMEIYGEIAG